MADAALRVLGAAVRPVGITRRCSGPSRRVSFLWFESRRGAGSATDWHYVRPLTSRLLPLRRLSNALVIEMKRDMSVVLYILVLIAVVVSVDLLFFKNRFWERLIVNIGIVLVFAGFYLRFLKNP